MNLIKANNFSFIRVFCISHIMVKKFNFRFSIVYFFNSIEKYTTQKKIAIQICRYLSFNNFMCLGTETRFSVTAESNGMLCIPLQRNTM